MVSDRHKTLVINSRHRKVNRQHLVQICQVVMDKRILVLICSASVLTFKSTAGLKRETICTYA